MRMNYSIPFCIRRNYKYVMYVVSVFMEEFRHQFDIKLGNLKNQLVQMSLGNGVIDEDELQILEAIDRNVGQLRPRFRQIVMAGRMTSEDRADLLRGLKKLFEDAMAASDTDKVLTRDEMILLKLLRERVIELQKIVNAVPNT